MQIKNIKIDQRWRNKYASTNYILQMLDLDKFKCVWHNDKSSSYLGYNGSVQFLSDSTYSLMNGQEKE